MELLTANLGKTRRATLHGREHIVGNSTLLVPGVLPGSKGPLLYEPVDAGRHPDNWNRMPIVVNHPTRDDGTPTSARRPAVLDKYQIGDVYETVFNGRLVAETWFDVELTRQADSRLSHANKILPRLERGEPIELSTGLYTRNEPVSNGAQHNGVPYTHVARDYRPDHLAVLPDTQGACSLRDGCGVLVNGREQGFNDEDVDGLLDNMAKGQPRDEDGRWTDMGASHASSKNLADHASDKSIVGLAGHLLKLNLRRAREATKEGNHKLAEKYLELVAKHRKGDSGITRNEDTDADDWDDAEDTFAGLDDDFLLNALPDMTPEKACLILKDGSVKGHKLTRQQQKMFGALCSKKPTANAGNEQTSVAKKKPCQCGDKKCECECGHEPLGTEHKTSTTVENTEQPRDELGRFASFATDKGGKLMHTAGTTQHFSFQSKSAAKEVHEAAKKGGKSSSGVKSRPAGFVVEVTHPPTGNETSTTVANYLTQNQSEEISMARDADITYLTTNCDCWKGKADSLKQIGDDTVLANLRQQAEKNAELTLTVNTLAGGGRRTTEGPKTAEQWYAEAPPEIQEVVRNAKAIQDGEKLKLVERIVANNASTKAAQDAIRPTFVAMSLPTLQTLAANLPEPTANVGQDNPFSGLGLYVPQHARRVAPAKVNDYSGAAGGTATLAANGKEEDVEGALMPTINDMNWAS